MGVLADIILMLADNIKSERVLKLRKQKGTERGNMERIQQNGTWLKTVKMREFQGNFNRNPGNLEEY